MDCIDDSSCVGNANSLNKIKITFPTPYLPPVHPVLTNHTFTLCFVIFSCNKSAYVDGFKGKKAYPKQAEKVGVGSLIPCSVPAILAVYPE